MKIKLADILPNPYRSFEVNPLDDRRIAKLLESIEETGFWLNVTVRPKGDKYESAFGHHRIEAARKAGMTEVDVQVQDLTNEQMIKMLARDNDEAYNATVLSVVETVRGVVQGLADGSLQPVEIPRNTPKETIRYAPSFTPGETCADSAQVRVPYTPLTIATLLGYTKSRDSSKGKLMADNSIEGALGALWLMQLGKLDAVQIMNMSVDSLRNFVRDAIGRVNEQRKREAQKIKDEAAILKIEQEKKAFIAEEEAKIAEVKREREKLEQAKREAETKRQAQELAERITKRKAEEERRAERLKIEKPKFDARMEAKKKEQELSEKERKEKSNIAQANVAVKGLKDGLNIYREGQIVIYARNVFSVARNPYVKTEARETLRQAMLAAGEWFIENANLFLPVPKKDVLKEAQEREDAKRRSKKEVSYE